MPPSLRHNPPAASRRLTLPHAFCNGMQLREMSAAVSKQRQHALVPVVQPARGDSSRLPELTSAWRCAGRWSRRHGLALQLRRLQLEQETAAAWGCSSLRRDEDVGDQRPDNGAGAHGGVDDAQRGGTVPHLHGRHVRKPAGVTKRRFEY